MQNNMFGPFMFIPYGQEFRSNETNLYKIKPSVNYVPNLFTPEEALIYGNIFKDQYRSYKNYVPSIKRPVNDQIALMYMIEAYSGAAHDLTLYLDSHPTEQELIKLQMEYSKKAKELKDQYQQKYGPLCASDSMLIDGKFGYVLMPSQWM